MKKFAAIILVLALSIMFTSAFATEKSFGMAVVTDLEGNILYIVQEDNSVVDPDGNAVDYIPYITMSIDDEALTFLMSSATQSVSGTVEVLEAADTEVTLQLTPAEGGDAITAVYTTEDGNMFTLVDEANNMLVMMTEIEAA